MPAAVQVRKAALVVVWRVDSRVLWFGLLAVVGFLAGVAILTAGTGCAASGREFTALPELTIWWLSLGVNLAVWFASFPLVGSGSVTRRPPSTPAARLSTRRAALPVCPLS